MSIFESLVGLVAPVNCVDCGAEGSSLCEVCRQEITPFGERCFHCNQLTPRSKTCSSCYSSFPLRRVHVATSYQEIPQKLVKSLKFGHQRPAAISMTTLLPDLDYSGWLCLPMPTVTKHVRERGFDHAVLFAKKVAQAKNAEFQSILRRSDKSRQVGTKRHLRITQLRGKFWLTHPELVKGKKVVLVDDVVTTGSSLREAAQVLRKAGAKNVDAIVFAKRL